MAKMNIAFTIDNKYVKHMAATIASILKNSREEEEFDFYVLNGGDITKENKRKMERLKEIKSHNLEWVGIDRHIFDGMATGVHYTTNFRLKVCGLLPDLRRLLFLDTDMIILDSLSEFYNVDLNKDGKRYYAAAVHDPCPAAEHRVLGADFDNVEIFNTGAVLIDCDAWRENNIEEKIFNTLKWFSARPTRAPWPDQSSINHALNGYILPVSPRFNACSALAFAHRIYDPNYSLTKRDNWPYEDEKQLNEAFENPAILHYCGDGGKKAWNCPALPYGDRYFDYLKLTPFYEEAIYEYIGNSINDAREALISDMQNRMKADMAKMKADILREIPRPKEPYKFPKPIGKLMACFIPKRANRRHFRAKYVREK